MGFFKEKEIPFDRNKAAKPEKGKYGYLCPTCHSYLLCGSSKTKQHCGVCGQKISYPKGKDIDEFLISFKEKKS